MEKTDITIIGAGVVGLAVAAELSNVWKNILILEKNSSFGQETSSRNSEVIHAGIYYPPESLKTITCMEGKGLLYEFCLKNNIPHKKTGKFIIACEGGEVKDLEQLFRQGINNGVKDLRLLSKDEIKAMEPHLKAEAAIFSPSTGILDTHSFMKTLAFKFESLGGRVAYNTEFVGADKVEDGFKVRVEDRREGVFEFLARILINCAGLYSDAVSAKAGVNREEYKLKFCKGSYFRVHSSKAGLIKSLAYPVPGKGRAGLGIHATLDLGGGLRLGPDDEYVEKIDYGVDITRRPVFYDSARKFLPFLEFDDIEPDTAGVRPKLQGPGEGFRDFIVQDEGESSREGLINLIGIESPGLTGALSIARMVKKMTQRYL